MPFSPLRALRRNRVIHALGQVVLVAQSRAGQGGTWNGTARNLQNRWTPVRVLDDGSEGAQALVQLGAQPIQAAQLQDLSLLSRREPNFLELFVGNAQLFRKVGEESDCFLQIFAGKASCI